MKIGPGSQSYPPFFERFIGDCMAAGFLVDVTAVADGYEMHVVCDPEALRILRDGLIAQYWRPPVVQLDEKK